MALDPPYGGCPWPVDPACLGAEWDDLDPDVQERAIALASTTLHRLTAYRVGGCPLTIRPCTDGMCWGYFEWWGSGGIFNPYIDGVGKWHNSCGCGGSGCATNCEVPLPQPVGGIVQVKVDGVVLDADDYQLQDGNILVWIGADPCPWPKVQSLSKPDTEAGTFSVTLLNSYPVDNLGATAAAFLAMEFARACKPKGKCALPRGVVSVVRNDISFEIEAGLFPNGQTGIDVVDAFIDAWNPQHRTQQTRVYTPGV